MGVLFKPGHDVRGRATEFYREDDIQTSEGTRQIMETPERERRVKIYAKQLDMTGEMEFLPEPERDVT